MSLNQPYKEGTPTNNNKNILQLIGKSVHVGHGKQEASCVTKQNNMINMPLTLETQDNQVEKT